jgi:hypothetical protein
MLYWLQRYFHFPEMLPQDMAATRHEWLQKYIHCQGTLRRSQLAFHALFTAHFPAIFCVPESVPDVTLTVCVPSTISQ